jgi:hypothetical protein
MGVIVMTAINSVKRGSVCVDKDGCVGVIFETSLMEGISYCVGFSFDMSRDVWNAPLSEIKVISESLDEFFLERLKEEVSEDVDAILRAVESCIHHEVPLWVKPERLQDIYDALSDTIKDKAESRRIARKEAGLTLVGGQDITKYVKKVPRKIVGSL